MKWEMNLQLRRRLRTVVFAIFTVQFFIFNFCFPSLQTDARGRTDFPYPNFGLGKNTQSMAKEESMKIAFVHFCLPPEGQEEPNLLVVLLLG